MVTRFLSLSKSSQLNFLKFILIQTVVTLVAFFIYFYGYPYQVKFQYLGTSFLLISHVLIYYQIDSELRFCLQKFSQLNLELNPRRKKMGGFRAGLILVSASCPIVLLVLVGCFCNLNLRVSQKILTFFVRRSFFVVMLSGSLMIAPLIGEVVSASCYRPAVQMSYWVSNPVLYTATLLFQELMRGIHLGEGSVLSLDQIFSQFNEMKNEKIIKDSALILATSKIVGIRGEEFESHAGCRVKKNKKQERAAHRHSLIEVRHQMLKMAGDLITLLEIWDQREAVILGFNPLSFFGAGGVQIALVTALSDWTQARSRGVLVTRISQILVPERGDDRDLSIEITKLRERFESTPSFQVFHKLSLAS